MSQNDWARQLRLAALHFSISPDEFWKLSVWEWMQLTAPSTSEFMNSRDLQSLSRKFPDNEESQIDDQT